MLLVLSLHQKKELNNTTLAFILGVIGVVISFLIPTEEKVIDEDSKKPSTVTTVGYNPDTVCDVAVETPSTVPTTVSTVSTVCSDRIPEPTPTDYRPTQQELTSAQPLPPLIDLAKLIPFDSLVAKETIYDGNHTPYTLKQLVDGVWECTNGRTISPSNISIFHRAPKTAWD